MSLLSQAIELYDAVEVPPHRRHVNDAGAHAFSRAAKALFRDAEEISSPVWDSFITAARAARWRAAADPTPLDMALSTIAPPLSQVIDLGHQLEGRIAQDQESLIQALTTAAVAYQAGANTAFSTTVMEHLRQGSRGDTCLVVPGRRVALAAQAWLAAEGLDITVLVPREYQNGRVWDEVIVAGPGCFYSPQMLTAPRARQVMLIHHSWIRDSQEIWGIFGSAATSPFSITVQEPPTSMSQLHSQAWDGAEASDIQLVPDWSTVFAAAPRSSAEDAEAVPARLAILGGGYAIWLGTKGERIRGLDPGAPPGKRVQDFPLTQVTPGSVLVLRSDVSEAAATHAVAYGILGSHGQRIKRLQDEWKTRLRDVLVRYGITGTRKKLLGRGASTANVVYWAHEDSVRPLRDDDFRFLLQMLGISETEQYLDAGRMLWRACSSAGRRIAEALERKAESVDLRQLELDGVQELHLDSVPGAAAMTAFRVLAISSETTAVSPHDTRRPFPVKGVEWLE